jgi:hypothetical protein
VIPAQKAQNFPLGCRDGTLRWPPNVRQPEPLVKV